MVHLSEMPEKLRNGLVNEDLQRAPILSDQQAQVYALLDRGLEFVGHVDPRSGRGI